MGFHPQNVGVIMIHLNRSWPRQTWFAKLQNLKDRCSSWVLQADLVQQARNILRRAHDYILDAMCVSVKHDEITVSLPILSHGCRIETSQGHSLFVCFLRDSAHELQGLYPQVVRHKKQEVELDSELFVKALCRSDRPGFALTDSSDVQCFNLDKILIHQQVKLSNRMMLFLVNGRYRINFSIVNGILNGIPTINYIFADIRSTSCIPSGNLI